MTEGQTCSRCGVDFTQSTSAGLCPGCLLREGLAVSEEPADDTSTPTAGTGEPVRLKETSAASGFPAPGVAFGDYDLLEKLGQGGMGVVYKAQQKSLSRVVAIKLLLFGPNASPDSVKRFRAEAVATAALQHPNIVGVHEVGFCQGQHFLAMDYVQGQCLSTLIRGTPLPARRAAGYVKAIAEAIHFAHEHGILHRDLKPANVLIDAHDQPRVTDFGLARRIENGSELTLTGQVVGSPNYMPPEQAASKRGSVSRRSDVYALGAILYEALTGQPPFIGGSFAETVQQVLNSEPPPPRVLQPGVPADLETVCLKCLEKEPAKRYATAQLLADELDRFLQGQPVHARPVGPIGKTWRWCRRNPRLALAVGVALFSLLSGLFGVSWQWRRAESQRRYAETKEALAQQNAYAADMNLAQRALAANQANLALSLLVKYQPAAKSGVPGLKSNVDPRGWEWRYLWELCRPDLSSTLTEKSGRLRAAAISRDGKMLAAATAGKEVNIWDLDVTQRLAELSAPGWLKAMTFSADKRLLAVSRTDADRSAIEIWELPSPRLARTFAPAIAPLSLSFSPDGRLLATLNDRGTFEILDWQSERSITNFTPAPFRRGGTGVVAFSPDGNLLAMGADYGWLGVMNLRTFGVRPIETGTLDGVSALAFSPDNQLLAACFAYSGETVCLWDPDSAETRGQLTNAAAYVRALAFSPDGCRLAAASVNGSIGIWDVAERFQVRRLRGHREEGLALVFDAAGRKLISACGQNTACGWDLAVTNQDPHAEFGVSFGWTPNLSGEHFTGGSLDPKVVHRLGFAFTPDSRNVFTTEPDGTVGMRDVHIIRQPESFGFISSNCWGLALSPDAHWLAAGEAKGTVRVWDWQTRRLEREMGLPFQFCGALRFSAGGRFLLGAATMNDRKVISKTWRTDHWEEIPFPPLQERGAFGRALSPDEQFMAIGYTDGTVKLWEFPSGRLQRTLTNHQSSVIGLAFSPDGRRLATVGSDTQILVHDVIAGRLLAKLPGHSRTVWSVAFSPDGLRLVTGGDTPREAVKLWDVATERELLTLEGRGQLFVVVGFSPDGNTIMATSLDGVAHLWRAPSWDETERADGSRLPNE